MNGSGSMPRGRPRACALVALLLLSALLGAGTAAAQDDIESWLEQADVDGDGRIERGEAPVTLLPQFDRFDLNGDGALDRFERYDVVQALRREREREAEAATRQQAPSAGAATEPSSGSSPPLRQVKSAVELQRVLDRNGDGVATLDEIPQSRIDLLLAMDQDGDRAVTVEEALAIDEGRVRPTSAASAPAGHRTLAETVSLMDTDGDGRLQKKEAPRALQQVFWRFDRNGDGAIDLQEAAAADASVGRGPAR